jgi:hypothetical protein
MEEFRRLPSIKEAIRHAALCHLLPTLNRHPHQYRLRQSVLQAAERNLQRASRAIARVSNFEALHSVIDGEIGSMHGVGPLTVYDIAHRIGAFLSKKPKVVYLHRDTRVGARRLGFTADTLAPDLLPSEFARLTPAEIEDCLCIYKDRLRFGQIDVSTSKSCVDPRARGPREFSGRCTHFRRSD